MMSTKSSTKSLSLFSTAFTTTVLAGCLALSGCSNNDATESVDASNDSATNEVTTNAPTADATTANQEESSSQTLTANDVNETSMPSEAINPLTTAPEQPSLVNNPTEPGTPEDAVKQALNTLYYGDVEDAVGYYKVDMANFENELANTQAAFQQTVEGVTITNTQYSVDKTKATITGEIRLKGQSEPAPLSYDLQKVNGQWKILG